MMTIKREVSDTNAYAVYMSFGFNNGRVLGFTPCSVGLFNHLRTKSNPFYLKPLSIPRSKHAPSRLQKPFS